MKTQTVVRAWAERFPEREALVCGEVRITYAALEQRTNRLAHALRAYGVNPGDRVALLLPNGIAWPEACLAALKLGALVVPVSPRLTADEVAFILADAQPHVLIYDGARAESALGAHGCALSDVDLYAAAKGASDAVLPLRIDSDDCMIAYTSGTSGRPKGAITTHANLLLIAQQNTIDFELRSNDRILVTTPFAHRAAIARLWNALTIGATLVVMARFDAAATLATIVRERITVTGVVPTVVRMMLDAFDGDASPYAGLRTMLTVGETCPVELKRRLFAALPHVKLYGTFAMTEVFGAAILFSDEQLAHAEAAGRPVPGVEVRLLDDAGKEVPTGEVGEIVVRCGKPGAWFGMRGYWNRPAETAETMRDGWIHSGDLGRFDAEGYLYVVDRKKDMILSGGLNIYSKEVERAVLSHPAVADVAVVATPDPQFGEAVVAFVELKRDARASADEIVAHCRAIIASYKKPKYVYFEALPRNGQGKALKTALRRRAAVLTNPAAV